MTIPTPRYLSFADIPRGPAVTANAFETLAGFNDPTSSVAVSTPSLFEIPDEYDEDYTEPEFEELSPFVTAPVSRETIHTAKELGLHDTYTGSATPLQRKPGGTRNPLIASSELSALLLDLFAVNNAKSEHAFTYRTIANHAVTHVNRVGGKRYRTLPGYRKLLLVTKPGETHSYVKRADFDLTLAGMSHAHPFHSVSTPRNPKVTTWGKGGVWSNRVADHLLYKNDDVIAKQVGHIVNGTAAGLAQFEGFHRRHVGHLDALKRRRVEIAAAALAQVWSDGYQPDEGGVIRIGLNVAGVPFTSAHRLDVGLPKETSRFARSKFEKEYGIEELEKLYIVKRKRTPAPDKYSIGFGKNDPAVVDQEGT